MAHRSERAMVDALATSLERLSSTMFTWFVRAMQPMGWAVARPLARPGGGPVDRVSTKGGRNRATERLEVAGLVGSDARVCMWLAGLVGSVGPVQLDRVRIAHPTAHASSKTLAQAFLKSFEVPQLRVSTSSEIQLLKWVANERAKQGELSATKISKNKGWMRWKSREELSR
ncbi:hypothetical protein F511_28469 [Dorcoceras hygrometricum]|uniref:Uncharacterized protein n=1 Tax=Dorcoceras hygrometricum TaxID=472368 RepID=A0A2Z7D4P0_9LAMI|nr:hypothetical protein F511_28469 [Dorcoceras hygrometricum]